MKDDVKFTKRMRELVEDGYIAFDKFGRWRVTESGLACLMACADRAVKTNAAPDVPTAHSKHGRQGEPPPRDTFWSA
jgi:hypothetical protein